MIKPLWYLDEKILVTILKVINLNRDLKEIILQLIIDEKYKEEFEFSIHNYSDEIVYLDTSDYYFSE